MKGSPGVVKELKDRLAEELAASIAYTRSFSMFGLWGYRKLASDAMDRAKDEMGHAHKLMVRIFELEDTIPTRVGVILTGDDTLSMITSGRDSEKDAIGKYNRSIEIARAAGDNDTAELFEGILVEETEHMREQDAFLIQIGHMTLANFLSSML